MYLNTHARPKRRALSRHPLTRMGAKFESDFIFRYLENLSSARALTVWLLYESGEHDTLANLSINPLDYNSAESFSTDYRATKFLSKYSALQTTYDKEAVAMKSFWESESRCFRTNRYLSSVRGAMEKAPALNGFLHSAALRIGRILGPFPGAEYFESNGCGWGPGSTSSVNGRYVSAVHKFQGNLETTPLALDSALAAVRYYDLWGSSALEAEGPVSVLPSSFTINRGNKLSLVPKNAKTDRVICVEPHCNVWLQKSVGNYIRRKLLRAGCNLNDQSINQKLARAGSVDGSLATIDLASASDSISIELVRDLLPPDWFSYLDALRSHTTVVDGKRLLLEKFSSMGNGFTFELETLIFLSLAESFSSETVSVYGDDIIVDTAVAPALVQLLDLCGFKTNLGKTFLEGPFRESCGTDCFLGTIVSPYYHKKPIDTVGRWVISHNAVRKSFSHYGFISRGVSTLLCWMRSAEPGLLGPAGYGDLHYHTTFDDAVPQRAGFQLEGFRFNTWLIFPVLDNRQTSPYGKVCTSLAPKGAKEVDLSTLFRGRSRAVMGRVLCAKWPRDILVLN